MAGLVSFGWILLLVAPAVCQEEVERYNNCVPVNVGTVHAVTVSAFEHALERGDDASIARLLQSSENLLFYYFDHFTKDWLAEPSPKVIAKLGALARGMEAAFGNGVYSELLERLRGFDGAQRSRLLEAYRGLGVQMGLMHEEGAVVPLQLADRTFEELQWYPGLVLGTSCR
jgi:hypothetical protein